MKSEWSPDDDYDVIICRRFVLQDSAAAAVDYVVTAVSSLTKCLLHFSVFVFLEQSNWIMLSCSITQKINPPAKIRKSHFITLS